MHDRFRRIHAIKDGARERSSPVLDRRHLRILPNWQAGGRSVSCDYTIDGFVGDETILSALGEQQSLVRTHDGAYGRRGRRG